MKVLISFCLLMASCTAIYGQQTHSVVLPIPQLPPCADPLSVQDDAETLRVYPNPASDFLFIASQEEIKAVTLYDLSGKIVLHSTNSGNLDRINIATVPNGIYLLQLSAGATTRYQKILIEK